MCVSVFELKGEDKRGRRDKQTSGHDLVWLILTIAW